MDKPQSTGPSAPIAEALIKGPARLGHGPDLLVGDGKGREEGWMVNGHYTRP